MHFIPFCGILSLESFLACMQPWCCGMCQATVLRRFVSISVIVSRLSMDSIAPSAFFHLSSGRIRLAPALFAEEAKNHDRATKSSPFPGRKDNSRTTGASRKCFCRPFYIDEREFANYSMLPELSFRRLPPNNAPAKPTRPHHRKLVPDPLAVDPVYVWAYHPLIVRL